VTHTRYCIDTTYSPDDEHEVARNVYRIEINIEKKELCVKLVIYRNYTGMHGQQNIKILLGSPGLSTHSPIFTQTHDLQQEH
jgi:hypothetical protein